MHFWLEQKGLDNKEWINELTYFLFRWNAGTNGDDDSVGRQKWQPLKIRRWRRWRERFPPVPCAAHGAIPALSFHNSSADSKEIKTVDVITTSVLSDAFNRATETAYKAVMKPKEGTILTVAKGMADKAAELAPQTEDVLEFSEKVLEHGEYVLSQTPEMLPVLKEAGVVDSGGQGLIQVIKGCIEGLKGKVVDIDAAVTPSVSGNGAAKTATGAGSTQAADIRFGYCTEFIINAEKPADETTEQEPVII